MAQVQKRRRKKGCIIKMRRNSLALAVLMFGTVAMANRTAPKVEFEKRLNRIDVILS